MLLKYANIHVPGAIWTRNLANSDTPILTPSYVAGSKTVLSWTKKGSWYYNFLYWFTNNNNNNTRRLWLRVGKRSQSGPKWKVSFRNLPGVTEEHPWKNINKIVGRCCGTHDLPNAKFTELRPLSPCYYWRKKNETYSFISFFSFIEKSKKKKSSQYALNHTTICHPILEARAHYNEPMSQR